jgi:hypothetical protein
VVKVAGYWLVADWRGGQLEFTAITKNFQQEKLSLSVRGYRLLQYQNRLFVHTDQGLTELKLAFVGTRLLAVPSQTWGVIRYATQWFEGLGVMDALGAAFLILPFGERGVAQVRVPELDDSKPLTAKAGNNFVAVMAMAKDGSYKKLEFTFDQSYSSYKVWEGVADNSELNMAILPRGVAAIITEDGELNVYVPTTGTLNQVQDKDITTDMILGNWDNAVVYIQKGQVWSIRMR